MALAKTTSPLPLPRISLAYDNTCNLAKLKVARQPLPLPAPLNVAWLNVEKVIDVLHLSNHISPDCKRFCPTNLKEHNPNFNTQAGEQTFVLVSRFRHILCSMNKTHLIHLFYLHRMVIRRNLYTAKCYLNGRRSFVLLS